VQVALSISGMENPEVREDWLQRVVVGSMVNRTMQALPTDPQQPAVE